MNDLTVLQGNLPAAFQTDASVNDELSGGISGGFAVVSFRGRVWRVKYKGEENPVLGPEGDPVASLQAVIVAASPHISKAFYLKKYVEGDAEEPDCHSIDGVRPDPDSASPQSDLCAKCPKNVFGSKITDNGKKAKACADTKRLAVVPYPDIDNEAFGGPMLLRLPPSALSDLAAYASKLKATGAPYYAVVTKLSFDPDAAYPKIKFSPVKLISDDEEARKIVELRNSDLVRTIIDTPTHSAAEAKAPTPPPASEPEPSVSSSQAVSEPEPPSTPPSKGEEAAPAEVVNDDVDALVASLLND